ncbi:ABC transporter ATP-binding protein [Lachnobacterium bovis]|uniref:ATP-binding cassette, subfamily B n=1 Tax=Lachnobacterium bovis DSM 14045 TaxID=1122142 RepID=A0A1H3JH11_9FIRM|nr:ABC transporter ATP-binding protein [Lachnobacterium bovis]SDY38805.1 ATP-binding cassette, subfamily B [Lachnobacterium bovis DSM 14045]
MIKLLKKQYALSEQGAKDMLVGILAVIIQAFGLMAPVGLIYTFTNDYINGVSLQNRIGVYVVGIIACLIFMIFGNYWQYNSSYVSTYKESSKRRISLAEKLRKLPLSFFERKDLADLSSTILADTEVLEHSSSHQIPQFYGSIICTVLVSICLFFYQWKMAIAAVWPIPVAIVIVFTSKKVQKYFVKKHVDAKVDLSEGIQEFIEASRDLKSNNAEKDYLSELDKKIDDVERKAIGNELGSAIFVVSAQILLKFGIATVALVGSSMLIKGELNMIQFVCFLLVASRLYEPMIATLVNLAALNGLQVSVDRMNRIFNTREQNGTSNFNPKGYDIKFNHVGFSYEDGKDVLSDVSFTAKQGEVTALVGPSGGGKTTVSRLAARFWDVDQGKVTIGGVDVSKVEPETLLSVFSIVFQDVTLFNNTVLENIRVGKKDATDEEVYRAARLANCEEFVENLPNGYNTIIGENGSELSGGERQRISIARAFLKDAPIILLDEATASLDVENETKVQSALSRLIKDKTVMVIAHRMRTVAAANKIVVLANGTVAEQGTPSELMKSKGMFSQMVSIQTGDKQSMSA